MNSNRIHISNRFSTIARDAAVTIFTVVSLSIFLGALTSNAFNVQDDVPGFVFPFIVSGFILGIIVAIARIKKI